MSMCENLYILIYYFEFILVLISHCLPGFELFPFAWWLTVWFLYCLHVICGAESLCVRDPRGLQPGTNISQGNIQHLKPLFEETNHYVWSIYFLFFWEICWDFSWSPWNIHCCMNYRKFTHILHSLQCTLKSCRETLAIILCIQGRGKVPSMFVFSIIGYIKSVW